MTAVQRKKPMRLTPRARLVGSAGGDLGGEGGGDDEQRDGDQGDGVGEAGNEDEGREAEGDGGKTQGADGCAQRGVVDATDLSGDTGDESNPHE